jgi:putative inorganic carbon (hco3(-)) transporter
MKLLPASQKAGTGTGILLRQPEESRTGVLREAISREPKEQHQIAYIATVIFSILLYLRPNEIYPGIFGVLPFPKIVAVGAVGAYFLSKIRRGEPLTIWPLELKMVLFMFFLGVIFIPVAANPGLSIEKLNDPFLKVVVIFFLMINLIDSRKRLRLLMSAVVLCGIPLALHAIKSFLNGEFALKGMRITGLGEGLFGNPNDLAICLNMLIPLTVVLGLTTNGFKRLIFLGAALIMSAGIMCTYSRGGFLGLIAAGLVMVWKLSKRKRIRTMILVFVTSAVLLPVLPGSYGQRILTIFESDSDATGSSNARKELLERGIAVALSHPIVGVGFGNFPIHSIKEMAAHNSYVEIAAELGALGLLAYLLVILAPLQSTARVEKDAARDLYALDAGNPGKTGILRRGGGQGDPNAADREAKREFYFLVVGVRATLMSYLVVSFFGSIQYLWYLYYPAAYAIALVTIHRLEKTKAGETVVSEKTGVLTQNSRERGDLWGSESKKDSESKKGVYWLKSSARR